MNPRTLPVLGRLCAILATALLCACATDSGSQAPLGIPAVPPSPGADGKVTTQAQRTAHLPMKEGSLRFAVVGDAGSGAKVQYDVAKQMEAVYKRFPFEFVIMPGDNTYGADTPADMKQKFELPYAFFHDKGIKFYACLGNHDSPNQRFYKLYNMNGERYYTFKPRNGVRFFALDSNYIEAKQLEWLEKELDLSGADWKIVYFHHPLYSSALGHGSSLPTREVLEPLLVKHGVSVVIAGHDHTYERIKPQKGIVHFVVGASGKLRKGDLRKTDFSAKGYDQDLSFAIMEIAGDELFYEAISRTGQTVDSGSLRRTDVPGPAKPN
jgi:predicted phosphodiesterase